MQVKPQSKHLLSFVSKSASPRACPNFLVDPREDLAAGTAEMVDQQSSLQVPTAVVPDYLEQWLGL